MSSNQGQPDGNASEASQSHSGSTPTPAPGLSRQASVTGSGAARYSPSPSRPPYIPQFTAATQMILNRMKGDATSLSSALATTRASVSSSAYEDARRRLVATMATSTSMTMQMPAAASQPDTLLMPTADPGGTALSTPATTKAESRAASGPAGTPKKAGKATGSKTGSGSAQRGTSGSGPGAKTAPAASTKTKQTAATVKLATSGVATATPSTTTAKTSTSTGIATTSAATAPAKRPRAGAKRKRSSRAHEDTSDSDLSDSDDAKTFAPTTTKSGRHVQRPTTYNPAAMDSSTKKRTHYGKRTAEQALCKRCTRMAFTDRNQMVFCDGCDAAWHQRCHEPEIEDEVVHSNAKWYCINCTTKKERQEQPKKAASKGAEAIPVTTVAAVQAPEKQDARVSWAGRTAGQKRAYLSGLSQDELVGLLMHAVELQPELAIFPADESSVSSASSPTIKAGGTQLQQPRSLFAGSTMEGLFPRSEANPTGTVNYVRKVATPTGATDTTTTTANDTATDADGHANKRQRVMAGTPFDPDEEDPTGLMEAWPKPGRGLYSRLPPEWEDDWLVDNDDYEAFSHIVYDDHGNIIEENGVKMTGR